MIRPAFRLAAEGVSIILVLLLVLAGAAIWRLSQGPVAVGFLTPVIERALTGAGLQVDIQDTLLSWGGGDSVLELRARGVRVVGTEGVEVASLPELGIGLDLRRLVTGTLAPTRLELVRPRIRAVRDEAGEIHLDIFENADPRPQPADAPDVGMGLLQALSRAPGEGEGVLAELREVGIEGAALTLEDLRTGRFWHAPRFDGVLHRDAGGVRGAAGLDLAVGQGQVRLGTRFSLRLGVGAEVEAELHGLRPADLAARAPELASLAAVSLTLGGTASARFDRGLLLREARFDLSGEDGAVNLPELWAEPLHVARARLRGHLDAAARLLTIEGLEADLDGPRLALHGTLRDLGGALDLDAQARLQDVALDGLGRLWPASVAPSPRGWITENLSHGTVDAAEAKVSARLGLDGAVQEIRTLDTQIHFRDVTVRYFGDLPPVTGVSGTARIDRARLEVDGEGGRLRDAVLGRSRIVISGLDAETQAIDIRIPLTGPLRTVLEVVDMKPLGYPSRLGIKPATAGGRVDGVLTFAFPLVNALTLDEIVFGAKAQLAEVALQEVVGDMPVTEGAGTLTLDPRKLAVEGTARLAGVPLSFAWDENFARKAEFSTRVRARGTLAEADRVRLGHDLAPWLAGPVGFNVTYLVPEPGRATLSGDLALAEAELAAAPLGWRKPPGTEARGRFELAFRAGKPVGLPAFSLDGAGMRLRGRADLAADFRPTRIQVDELTQGENRQLRAEIRHEGQGPWRVNLQGASLDLGPLHDDMEKTPPVRDPGKPRRTAPEFPLEVQFRLGRLLLGAERVLREAGGTLAGDGRQWTRASVDARVGDGVPMLLQYVPDGAVRRLTLETMDGGSALRALGIYETVRGGRLLVSGTTDARDPDAPLQGSIELQDFSLTEAPALARLLNAVSPTGFAELLSSRDIRFDRLSAEWEWKGNRILVRKGRTAGAALGLTADGLVDLNEDRLDFEGTIVPIYGLNRIIGSIPLLGRLLTGGEGQGIFAFTYSLRGPMDDPAVTVNPLSVLTPGFLRNLFFLGDAPGEERKPPPPGTPPPGGSPGWGPEQSGGGN
ncbi:YhdP family protein [Arenibaculum pallidiluteum]|uniref:YhdP family protein n=1 Tax=Arenibaculum pallidiluteum TaxID=2812559 RepID=UPI001A95AF8A|nr:AsmA-like C-terminal region-containing protein [Arenibaculum pallidiluteum]